ncbi:SDR family NAD(P)-dependent oxidoreductase, partial [Eubacterium aggregans]|uniref:SDR family NAD(P)-dependent oxidoreductase n=1 Tax=Eubacterium aggregans TaxID=81409 RepID=UPI003F381292
PGAMGKVLDQVFLQYARKRRRGILTFLLDPSEDNPEINVAEFEQLQEIRNEDDAHRIIEKTQAYINSKQVSQMNLADYAEKHTLITGGASGIALILAEELLSDGAIVVLADNNSKNLTCEVKRLSALYPNTVSGIFCDITVEAQVYAMVAEAQERMNGMLDLLINEVDVGQLHFFADTPRARAIRKKHPGMEVLDNTDWERILSINFYGTLYCCRAALPIMTAQKTGQIINMISNTAF